MTCSMQIITMECSSVSQVYTTLKYEGKCYEGVGGSTRPKTGSEILSVSTLHEVAAVANETRYSSTIIWVSIILQQKK